jgi:hypothetical protein
MVSFYSGLSSLFAYLKAAHLVADLPLTHHGFFSILLPEKKAFKDQRGFVKIRVKGPGFSLFGINARWSVRRRGQCLNISIF